MSDLLPTKEQETVALNACSLEYDTGHGVVPAAEFEDVALLLAEREAALVGVICRLRALLGEVLLDDHIGAYDASGMLSERYDEIKSALEETAQYEVVK